MGIDSKLPDLQISEVDIIDVDVDDQAKTTTLGALSPEKAASALAKLEGKDANGTQEIDFGDVLEVSSKLEAAPASEKPAPVSTRSAPKSAPPRPSSRPVKTAPPSDMAVSAVVVPPPPSAPQVALPSVMVRASTPDATAEVRADDVLEVIADAPAPAPAPNPFQQPFAEPVPAPQTLAFTPPAAVTKTPSSPPAGPARNLVQYPPDASIPIPAAEVSTSDIAKTNILPPKNGRRELAQFSSAEDDVAPLTSDTSEIALDGIAGMPLWMQLKNKPQFMVVGGALSACVALGVLALGIHVFGGSKTTESTASTTSAQTTTVSAAAAASPIAHDDKSDAIPPPPEQNDGPTVSIDDLKKDGRDGSDAQPWSGAHHHHHHADMSPVSTPAAPAVKTKSSTKSAAAATPKGFGLIRTWIAARGETISVDGKAVGVAPSPVRVACGPHTVAIGKEVVKANVPCDGAVTVGSPDHKKQ